MIAEETPPTGPADAMDLVPQNDTRSHSEGSRSRSRSRSRSPKHQRLASEVHDAGQPRSNATAELAAAGNSRPSKFSVDRQKTCPMYVRLFCRVNGHHRYFATGLPALLTASARAEEFTRDRQPIDDELNIYTWKDATLRELSDLIKEVNTESRRRDARLIFRLVYPDLRGDYRSKPLGTVSNTKGSREDYLTLEELRFLQGDFIDVSIMFGAATAPLPGPAFAPRSGSGYGREHGHGNAYGYGSSSEQPRRPYEYSDKRSMPDRSYRPRGARNDPRPYDRRRF